MYHHVGTEDKIMRFGDRMEYGEEGSGLLYA
jgi:hypothetical protein